METELAVNAVILVGAVVVGYLVHKSVTVICKISNALEGEHKALEELENEKKITVTKDKDIVFYIDMEKFMNPSNEEFAIGTLNRAKLIIDEYNELLNNNNKYGHVSILRDIEKAIKKLEKKD